MTLALRYAVRSDVGLLREGNEDSAFAGPRLIAVADGMGGHAAGEVASAVAISTISRLAEGVPDNAMLDALARAVAVANRTLHDMSAEDPAKEGMGTTLTAMLWSGVRFGLCHIGDSRGYLLRGDELRRITRDHTLVQALVDDGRISAEEATTHPQRSLLLRALDGTSEAEPDLVMLQARVGDRYLLCSDGLTDVVSEPQLHRTLATLPDPDEAVLRLIDLAIKGGGPDNITCIVADVVDTSASTVAPSEKSVLVGAAAVATEEGPAANGSGPATSWGDGPTARAQVLTRPAAPAPAATFRSPSPSPAAEQDEDDDLEERPRRRWPIVTSLVVVLLAVVGGAAYAGWNYTQQQYYVGEHSGKVVIFQGVNQNVAGLPLSHVYQTTSIPVAGLPSTDVSSVRGTIPATTGLPQARRIVGNIRNDYNMCHQAYLTQVAYNEKLATYRSQAAAYYKAHKTLKPVVVNHKTIKPPVAPPQPAGIPAECPAHPAAPSGGA